MSSDEATQHNGENKMQEIKAMYNDFYIAYINTSFSPEKRAESCVNDFSAELKADLAELGDKAGNYKEKYIEHLRKWVSRKSRCLSSMITGPANFPTVRNRKAFEQEQRAWKSFNHGEISISKKQTAFRQKPQKKKSMMH